MLTNIRSIPNKRQHKKKKDNRSASKSKVKKVKNALSNQTLTAEDTNKSPVMYSNNNAILNIEVSNHFNENVMIDLNKNISKILNTKKLLTEN